MKYLLVLAFVAMACASAIKPINYQFDDAEIEVINDPDAPVQIAPQFVLSWQVRRFIRKLQKQMPCGFPEMGIPPLAPLKLSEGSVHLQKGYVETFDEVTRLRLDGLDDFKIMKFKLNMISSKITFDFLFNDIKVSAPRYATDTILDALREIGLSVEYEGEGALEFGLKNLRVAGTLKYKIPILWGSIKILSLQTTVKLESCYSDIEGFLGEGSLNRMVNRQLENVVEQGINNNEEAISRLIEDTLVPPVNRLLKGNDFWTLVDYIFSSSEGEKEDDPIVTTCIPPEDPWNP